MTAIPSQRDFARITVVIFFIGLMVAGSFLVLKPFMAALVWATMIVIATWPLMRSLQQRLGGRRGLAVTVMTLVLLLVLIVPLWFAIGTIINNAGTINDWAVSLKGAKVPAPPHWVESVPVVGPRVAAKWQQLIAGDQGALLAKLSPYVSKVLGWFVAQVGGLGMLFIHFLLTVILSAVLYLHGESAAQGVLLFARRLSAERGEDAAHLAARAIRAVALGIVVTALVQSIIAGLGLLIAGIPYAILLTAVIFMLGVIQVGPMPIMIPTVLWLFWSGSNGWGAFITVITVLVGVIDNFLRPFLIKKGADLPLLLVFAGVIGGLLTFGIIGLFVGPVVLAVTYTLLKAWVLEGAEPHSVSS